MSAPPNGTLQTTRDALYEEIARLEAIIARALSWAQNIERDRAPLTPQEGVEFDAAITPMAEALLTELQHETSRTLTSGLNLRIANVLGIQS